ncbi:unnamed protein product [Vicia faba]|uniref:Uncharacterized protein n=1 Tax=Vicia faba TaxID=3906 RepID=A0AAV0YZJ9_VICFA|nr:unnamed protein product [Vicia faba]
MLRNLLGTMKGHVDYLYVVLFILIGHSSVSAIVVLLPQRSDRKSFPQPYFERLDRKSFPQAYFGIVVVSLVTLHYLGMSLGFFTLYWEKEKQQLEREIEKKKHQQTLVKSNKTPSTLRLRPSVQPLIRCISALSRSRPHQTCSDRPLTSYMSSHTEPPPPEGRDQDL